MTVYIRRVYLLVEISSIERKAIVLLKKANRKGIDHAKWSLLAQKRKFFLNPRKRNNAPTVSNTPPTGTSPKGTSESIRNAKTPIPKKMALREM